MIRQTKNNRVSANNQDMLDESLLKEQLSVEFRNVSPSFHAAPRRALKRIEKKRRARRAVGLAVLCICAAMTLLRFAPSSEREDKIVSPNQSENNFVWCSYADEYYHTVRNCEAAAKSDEKYVQLALCTAQEFHKSPCPTCCGGNHDE